MRSAISLLVLLFSMCGARSTQAEVQTETQNTGAPAAAAEVSTQQMQEINSVVLRSVQDELKVMKAENAAVKERLVTSETKVGYLESRLSASEEELAALKTKLSENLEERQSAKVAFSAGLTNSGYVQAGNSELNLAFHKVFVNVGQAYNGATGFFTAPFRGVYYFRFTVMDTLARRWMEIQMYKNGQKLMHLGEYDSDGKDGTVSGGLTVQMEKGDSVNLRIPAGYRLYDSDRNFSTFTGFLLFLL